MSQENVKVVERFYDAMARRDLVGVLDFIDAEVVLLTLPTPPTRLPTRATMASIGGSARWRME